MIRGSGLLDVIRAHDDEALLSKWDEARQKKVDMLNQKDQLHKRTQHTPKDIDFMFMKLPGMQEDGTRVPMTEDLTAALMDVGHVHGNSAPSQSLKDPLASL